MAQLDLDQNINARMRALITALETMLTELYATDTAAGTTYQPLTGNTFTVATLPAAASNVGRVVYCSNGAAGNPSAVISDGTNWKVAGTLGLTAAVS